MAKSENQGLQIAVIIFAFLTIALSVATFYFFNDASTQFTEAVAEKQKAQDKDALSRKVLDERAALASIIGHPPEVTPADAQKKFEEMIAKLAGVQFPANGRTYILAVDTLKLTIDQMNQERKDQKQKMDELEKLIKKVQDDYAAAVKQTGDKFEAEGANFKGEVAKYEAKDKEHVAKNQQLAADLDKKNGEMAKAIDEKNKEIQDLRKELAVAIKQASEAIKERYEKENWVFERPDATIVSVNAKTQTVNIDVGRADFLRLNIQFAVFSRGETNVHQKKKKGTVAVTAFINDNMAEARIVESNLKDPILQGDVVFTPTWTPGTQERFVLAGDFDVNGDRKPDNELVRTLVDLNGGAIDEDVSITTRYLLLGDAPPAADKVAHEKFTKVKSRAKELSIKMMGLQEFIEYIGGAEMLARLQDLNSRTKKDTGEILKDKRTLGKEFRKREPDGGTRRPEPGGAKRGDAGGEPSGEGSKKLPSRRPGGIQ